jgi:hypothetical protein
MYAAVRAAGRLTIRFLTLAAVAIGSPSCFGAGGTSSVATKGSPAFVNPHWPPGVAELLEHPARGDGWNSWFTEWPNDVNHYEFHVTNTQQLNDVIALFAKIRVWKDAVTDTPDEDQIGTTRVPHQEYLQPPAEPEIRLCPTGEPAGFGWVSKFDAGNRIPIVFTIGNQHQLDEWYRNFIGPRNGVFGVMIFADVPVAVPPTLTLFVDHTAVQPDKLEIPKGVSVSMGDLPGLWHKSNLVDPVPKHEAEEGQEKKVAVSVTAGGDARDSQVSRAAGSYGSGRHAGEVSPASPRPCCRTIGECTSCSSAVLYGRLSNSRFLTDNRIP